VSLAVRLAPLYGAHAGVEATLAFVEGPGEAPRFEVRAALTGYGEGDASRFRSVWERVLEKDTLEVIDLGQGMLRFAGGDDDPEGAFFVLRQIGRGLPFVLERMRKPSP